jgi:hypothetical protein
MYALIRSVKSVLQVRLLLSVIFIWYMGRLLQIEFQQQKELVFKFIPALSINIAKTVAGNLLLLLRYLEVLETGNTNEFHKWVIVDILFNFLLVFVIGHYHLAQLLWINLVFHGIEMGIDSLLLVIIQHSISN